MHIENCLWPQVAVLDICWAILQCLGQDMQVLDKFCIWVELLVQRRLPDFREKCRVIRHSRVFRGLTGSQRTPGFWGVIILSIFTHMNFIIIIIIIIIIFKANKI